MFLKVLLRICVFVFQPKKSQPEAVNLLDCTQIHKFTKEPLGTIYNGQCLLYFCCYLGGFVGAPTTQMRKYTNAQIAVPA
jgi:hypothetical protein